MYLNLMMKFWYISLNIAGGGGGGGCLKHPGKALRINLINTKHLIPYWNVIYSTLKRGGLAETD